MSGDVQPRKRKDKKKKKDDPVGRLAEAELIYRKLSVADEDDVKEAISRGVHAGAMGAEDVHIHVHKDHGTGGHWCAKIVFFALLAVLAGLVGLIILENRGLSDLDTPLSESRFSDILEGWVEENRESHDDHEVQESLDEVDEHDHDSQPFEEEDDHDGHEHEENDHDDDDDESEENEYSEEEIETNENEDDEGIDAGEEQDEEDDGADEKDQDEDSSEEDPHVKEIIQIDNVRNKREIGEEEENDSKPDSSEENDEDEGIFEGPQNNDETEGKSDIKEDLKEEEIQHDDDDDAPFEEVLFDLFSESQTKKSVITEMANATYQTNITGVSTKEQIVTVDLMQQQLDELKKVYDHLANDLNQPMFEEVVLQECPETNYIAKPNVKLDDDSLEQVFENDDGEELHLQKIAKKDEPAKATGNDEPAEESSSVAVKIGVGLALVVVAHQVLVKKSPKNENAEEKFAEQKIVKDSQGVLEYDYEMIDMRRRLTIVTTDENIDYEGGEYDNGELLDPDEDIDDEENGDYDEYDDENDEEGNYDEGDDVRNSDKEEPVLELSNQEPIETKPFQTFEIFAAMYRPVKVTQEQQLSTFDREEKKEVKIDETIEDKLKEPPNIVPIKYEYQEKLEDEDDDDYEEEDEEDDVSDVDDSELLERLDAKYGKLPTRHGDSDADDDDDEDATWTKLPSRSGAQSHVDQNDDDDDGDDLRRANQMLRENPESALRLFDKILKTFPHSPEALYGRAQALDLLADEQQSNEVLSKAIAVYEKLIQLGPTLNDDLFKNVSSRCINRMRFMGRYLKAVRIHEALISRFQDDPQYRNQLAVTYLLQNRLSDAKLVLHNTLLRWRDDGFALVHYGFVLLNLDKNYEGAAQFLQEGIKSGAEGTSDGRFYFALGEALTRLGRESEAMKVYEEGAKKKLFLSAYQRSLYNVNSLKSWPFWTVDQTKNRKYFEVLEKNWEIIRDEGLNILNQEGYFVDESENLREIGDWKQFDLFVRGKKIVKNCEKTPLTCKMIEMFPAARFCKRGQVKFSVMHPGTHVWPHCGPTNCRIRAHLGLQVPDKTFIRVVSETRSWQNGKLLIFDDSFEHEVWHNGTETRLILIIDIWHPDLSEEEKESLQPI